MMEKQIIQTDNAPAAVGPYAHAIRIGELVYTSGQIALDPSSGEMIGDNVSEQAEQVLKNLAAVLEAAGASMESVVKTTVFLQDMGDFKALNAVYAEHFSASKPARSTVAVRELPLGALVEVEAIALVKA